MSHLLMQWIHHFGYWGILFTMALESACIPIPSEVIMPFGGFLASSGSLHFWIVVFAGTIGNVVGSTAAYYVGRFGGRQVLVRYGRYIRISERHLSDAEHWFSKRGDWTVLISRILPIFRTFISFPAGISRMNIYKFIAYTAIGSLPWCYVLTLTGLTLGKNWDHISRFMHPFMYAVLLFIVIALIVYLMKLRKKPTV